MLSKMVNINDDIMKYLPLTSETKQGIDIMNDSFPKQDTSTLNVMFKDLSNEEKKSRLKELEGIHNVSSVDYDNTSEYNIDNYTLYVVNVDDYADSLNAKEVYDYIDKNYKVAGVSGSIADENKPLLQLWIVIFAITCAMIILIILSESYIEPFLYLISIGIAILINKGTNIIFPSVSSITDSIVAILQLALSMDYSIMLSNRFKQEKEKNKNKLDAMKEALYYSFISISSSSITTIVGLLALVFMSFTIGKDLGLVLAKGVLLSLVSIFFCLPALLLICDNLILKTKKKTIHFHLDKLGKFSYKMKYMQVFFIIFLFIITYFLKGNINILYTGSEQDKVGKVFQATNQVAIVYENKYEELITHYCQELEQDKKIDEVLCYSNTINQKLAYNELNDKFKDLDQDTNIDEYLIKLIYYKYFNKDNSNKMTLNQFINFIKKDIYNNKDLNKEITQDTKDNLDKLHNFTDKNLINKKRTTDNISNILDMNKKDASDILIYYNSKQLNTKMTIKDFVSFLLYEVATDNDYKKEISNDTLNDLKDLEKFVNKNNINKKMDASGLADMFNIKEDLIDKLLMYYHTTIKSDTKITLNEFANFALDLSEDKDYEDMFDKDTIKSLTLLEKLSDEKFIKEKRSVSSMKNQLKNLGFDLDDDSIKLLYIYYMGSNSNETLTLNEFANTALDMANGDYSDYFDNDTIDGLTFIKDLTIKYNTVLSNSELYDLFDVEEYKQVGLNYTLTGSTTGTYNMTPTAFVNLLLNTPSLRATLTEEEVDNLETAQKIIDNVDTNYKSSKLANDFEQDETIVEVIYGRYLENNNGIDNISIKELINFIYDNRNNDMLSDYIKDKSLIKLANEIVSNTKTKYNYKEIAKLIDGDKEDINKIFGLYDYENEDTKITPLTLTNTIIDNIEDDLIKDRIDDDDYDKVKIVNEVMESTLNNRKYTAQEISDLLDTDLDKTKLLLSLYDSRYIKANQNISLYNFVCFIISDVMNNKDYSDKISNDKKEKLLTIKKVMDSCLNSGKYNHSDAFLLLEILSDDLDSTLIDLVYVYYGSVYQYDDAWKLTIEELINYINDDILNDKTFDDYIKEDKRNDIKDAKETIRKAKDLIVSDKYSRIVLNTKYDYEGEETIQFIDKLEQDLGSKDGIYVSGHSSMAYEMSGTFDDVLNRITILTMIFIFVVVAITFKDIIIPFVLVLIIQTAVYVTMSIISITGGSVYFIALLIVQAILMGATIDYAIVYTAYYKESRLKMNVLDAIINAYDKSIHTIISSSSILIIVTLVVANFASAIAAKICETISKGTLAAVILIMFILPGVLAACDKLICRRGYHKDNGNNM